MNKLSPTQQKWFDRLRQKGRILFSKSSGFGGGMPERTAKSLKAKGLVRFEIQKLFANEKTPNPEAMFVVLN